MKKADIKRIVSIFALLSLLMANFFVFGAHAHESGNKLDIPFGIPYDNIENYDYPYLIPPPKIFNTSDLGMYQEDQDNEPKLFYVVKPSAPNIYWKERTYDVYTGQGWLIQNIDTRQAEKNIKSAGAPARYDIFKFLKKGSYTFDLIAPFTNQSAIDKNSFEISPENKFDLTASVYGDSTFAADLGNDTNIKYQADYYPPDFDIAKGGELKTVPKEIIEAYTALPDEFPQKLKDIAKDLKNKSNGRLADQILNTYKFVQDNVEYDLKWGAGKIIPKDYDMALWTLENKKGICSHFATLFITLARAQGIPARLAVGFAGGKAVGDTTYIYSSYAHGWAEIYLPNYGWVPIDPTKGARGGENGQQQGSGAEKPPEWSNGGNVRPDLKFTLDDQLQKEKDKSQQNGSGNSGNNGGGQGGGQNGSGGQGGSGGSGGGGGQGGSGSGGQGGSGGGGSGNGGGQGSAGGNSNFDGDPGKLSNLDKWFGSDDTAKLEEKYENWLKDQKKLAVNNTDNNIDKNTGKDNGGKIAANKNEEKKSNEDKSMVSELKKAVSGIAKNSFKNGFVIVALVLAFLAAYFIYKKYSKMGNIKNKLEERIKAVNRFVNIGEVIKKVKILGEKKEYNTAVVYGYNELEDYVAYVFAVVNDPSLTAREFESLFKEVTLFKPLNAVVEQFEKEKYSLANSEEDYNIFLAALGEIAAISKTKK